MSQQVVIKDDFHTSILSVFHSHCADSGDVTASDYAMHYGAH